MVMYRLVYTKQARLDAKKVMSGGLKMPVQALLAIVAQDPFQNPPPYKILVGDLKGAISRRINIQHRLVYQVLEEGKTVKIIRLWSYYD